MPFSGTCGKVLAIPVAGPFYYGLFNTISGNGLEKLLKNAIIMHCWIFYVQIKDVRYP